MMLESLALALHVLLAGAWVGGMFFAYVVLRPTAARLLEPSQRLPLWAEAFARFFPWVWGAVIILPTTGYLLIFRLWGGMGGAPLHVHLMHGLGWLMVLIFLYVHFCPYRRLREAVARQDWPAGGAALAVIRRWVGINLLLGTVVAAVAAGGRYV